MPSREGNRRRLVAPLAVGLVLWVAFVVRSTMNIDGHRYFSLFDDAMVSMRYARNLAQGHGLIWNTGGAHVEGYTNFLWTLWMAALHLLPLGSPTASLAVMISGIAILVATVLVAAALAGVLLPERPVASTIAAWVVALYYPLTFWTLRGMEVGLVALALLAAALAAVHLARDPTPGRAVVLGLLLVVAVLTRDDAAVPALVILAYVALASRRQRVMAVGIPVLLALAAIGGHAGFRLWYYDQLLPNTYALKILHNPLSGRLKRGAVSLGVDSLNELVLPLLLAVSFLATRRRWRQAAPLMMAGVFASLCLYSVYVGGDAWEGFEYANRYICAAVPFLLVLAALGIAELVAMEEVELVRRTRLLAAGCAGGAVLLALNLLPLATIQDTQPDAGSHRVRIILLLVAAAVLIALPRLRDSADTVRTGTGSSLPVVAVTAVTIAAISAVSWGLWARYNAKFVSDFDVGRVRYALVQRQVTKPDAVIAVAVAGAMPYFSGRPSVDLLGKSDKFIAHLKPRFPGFYPGHNKFDYAYSICQLRPDLVVELWDATPADRKFIEGCGYTRIRADDVYVRTDSKKVDRRALEAAIAKLEKQSPIDF